LEKCNRLTVLLLHLLRWQFQPALRGQSWRATIRVQRRDLEDHLADNPSLKAILFQAIGRAYGSAVIAAEAETGLLDSNFPSQCPWSFDQLMDPDFWPTGA
jgi:phage major head subunit gpT-like protein